MKNGRFVDLNGDIRWYQNDKLHRLDGPAIDSPMQQEWYKEGELHRVDGPAYMVLDDEVYEWYIDGKRVTNPHEYQKLTNISDELLADLQQKYGEIRDNW